LIKIREAFASLLVYKLGFIGDADASGGELFAKSSAKIFK